MAIASTQSRIHPRPPRRTRFRRGCAGPLRLPLSGPTNSGARPIPDASTPVPGGWNRIHLIVDNITAEVARARVAGLSFPNNIISGPVGQQILLHDPAGNLIELFQPANR
ncbi:VOC family protein [Mycobacterium sp.]|uniref:VOC family protein n=1 Tax=Mycobacterium sp. TaxID=1785 RepID=UPI003F9841AE